MGDKQFATGKKDLINSEPLCWLFIAIACSLSLFTKKGNRQI